MWLRGLVMSPSPSCILERSLGRARQLRGCHRWPISFASHFLVDGLRLTRNCSHSQVKYIRYRGLEHEQIGNGGRPFRSTFPRYPGIGWIHIPGCVWIPGWEEKSLRYCIFVLWTWNVINTFWELTIVALTVLWYVDIKKRAEPPDIFRCVQVQCGKYWGFSRIGLEVIQLNWPKHPFGRDGHRIRCFPLVIFSLPIIHLGGRSS